jgi:hypothetical protein
MTEQAQQAVWADGHRQLLGAARSSLATQSMPYAAQRLGQPVGAPDKGSEHPGQLFGKGFALASPVGAEETPHTSSMATTYLAQTILAEPRPNSKWISTRFAAVS